MGAARSDPGQFAVTVCYLRDLRDTVFGIDRRATGLPVDYVEVKERLAQSLNAFLDPMRERAAMYARENGLVDEIIYQGTMRYREIAADTLREVKKAMGITGTFNRIARKAEERQKKLAKSGAVSS